MPEYIAKTPKYQAAQWSGGNSAEIKDLYELYYNEGMFEAPIVLEDGQLHLTAPEYGFNFYVPSDFWVVAGPIRVGRAQSLQLLDPASFQETFDSAE